MATLFARVFGEKGWNPKSYAKKVQGVWVLTPAVFYPAMIEHIQESMAKDELPPELIDIRINPDVDPCLAARRYKGWARRISALAWSDALLPLSVIPARRIPARAEALECCRLWFTRALKNAEGPAGIRIRILKDFRFKLGTVQEFRA